MWMFSLQMLQCLRDSLIHDTDNALGSASFNS